MEVLSSGRHAPPATASPASRVAPGKERRGKTQRHRATPPKKICHTPVRRGCVERRRSVCHVFCPILEFVKRCVRGAVATAVATATT